MLAPDFAAAVGGTRAVGGVTVLARAFATKMVHENLLINGIGFGFIFYYINMRAGAKVQSEANGEYKLEFKNL